MFNWSKLLFYLRHWLAFPRHCFLRIVTSIILTVLTTLFPNLKTSRFWLSLLIMFPNLFLSALHLAFVNSPPNLFWSFQIILLVCIFGSNINEVIKTELNIFLPKDFARTKSTKNQKHKRPKKHKKAPKSTKSTKTQSSNSKKRK